MLVGCPRCSGRLQAPGLFSSDWQCETHGPVPPLHAATGGSLAALRQRAASSGVPVWAPWPLPTGWVCAGASFVGDDRAPAVAAVVAWSAPAPLGGPADVLLVAEEPGVGLGAALAGLDEPDPDPQVLAGPASTKVQIDGHPCSLWEVAAAADRAAYVGEALGCWLWAVAWPSELALELHDEARLVDLRDPGHELPVPFGALSPRLPLVSSD